VSGEAFKTNDYIVLVCSASSYSLVKDIGHQIAAVTHACMSCVQPHFCANAFQWLYSAETPSAFWGHLSWSVMTIRSWIVELNINQTFQIFADLNFF
jgi:hypothetical protein